MPAAQGSGPGRTIADHALLSDCQSSALVDGDGSVVWMPAGRFDGPTLFACLLDAGAGEWFLRPVGPFDSTRRYVDGSLVLETTFVTPEGRGRLTDVLLLGLGARGHDIGAAVPHLLCRSYEVLSGEQVLTGRFAPRPEYGAVTPRLEVGPDWLRALGGAAVLTVSGPPPTSVTASAAEWLFALRTGDRVFFALECTPVGQPAPASRGDRELAEHVADTVEAWRSWSALHRCHDGTLADLVHHSTRVLQALTYAPTGAMVAAATTSLPDRAGGQRNWDYRYCWTSDTGTRSRAQLVSGCAVEAVRQVRWLATVVGAPAPAALGAVYRVDGGHELAERDLTHLRGWRGSRPVRVGNRSGGQNHPGSAGAVLDAVASWGPGAAPLGEGERRFVADLADLAAAAWRDTDSGPWDELGPARHYLHSKVMCWVALDRAIALAGTFGGAAPARVPGWTAERGALAETIHEHGWNERLGVFTQAFGSDTLDASALVVVLTGFLSPRDPRAIATVERIAAELSAPCGLLWRYRAAAGADGEATFLPCSFALVECLSLAGEPARARQLFDRATAYANDLGLLAEEADPGTGELLGNFPHAASHIGLINAALRLDRAEQARQVVAEPPVGAGAGGWRSKVARRRS